MTRVGTMAIIVAGTLAAGSLVGWGRRGEEAGDWRARHSIQAFGLEVAVGVGIRRAQHRKRPEATSELVCQVPDTVVVLAKIGARRPQ